MILPFGLTPAEWLAAMAVFFGAAYVRGYSGFGYAALLIAGCSLFAEPRLFMPVVALSDIFLSLGQLPGVRRHIDWKRVLTLMAGAALVVPFSIGIVASMGPRAAQAAISLMILACALLVWFGVSFRRQAGTAAHFGTGIASGIAQGAGVGGLPVAAFFTAQPMAPVVFRANMIAYFFLLDLWSLPNLWMNGLVTRETLIVTAIGMPVLVLGVRLGTHRFAGTPPGTFRRFAILLLGSLAVIGLARALFQPG